MKIIQLEYGSSIRVGDDIKLTVHPPRLESSTKEIQVGIVAPKHIPIRRDDIKKTKQSI